MTPEEREKLAAKQRELTEGAKALIDNAESTADELKRADEMIGEAVDIEQKVAQFEADEKAAADRRERIGERESWAKQSRGTLKGMAGGTGALDGDDEPVTGPLSKLGSTGLERKGAFVGKQVDGEFVKLCRTDQWESNSPASKRLRTAATPEYKAAFGQYLRGGEKWATKALSEGVDTAGGSLVPPDIQAEIIRRLPGLAIVEERASTQTTTRDRVLVPRIAAATTDATMYSSAVSFTMVGETPSASAGDVSPSFEQIGVDIHTAKMETSVSRNLLADEGYDLEGFLIEEFRRAATLGKDDKFLTGDGTNQPLGITIDSDITAVASGVSGAMAADGLQALVHALPAQYRPGANLAFSRDALEDIAKLKDGEGRYLLNLMNGGGIAEGVGPQLLGVPYLVSDFLSSVSASATVGFYGNLQFYRVINRLELSIQVLDQVSARSNQNVYVAFLRFGGLVTVPEAFRLATVTA